MSWAAKYRPRTFEDVLGQPRAVELLGRLAVDPAPSSVVIYGPTGAGKTTLARIYAQARLCEAPTTSGSPCLACSACASIDQGRQREFRLYPPNLQNAEELQRIVSEIQRYGPISADRRVFLFDEVAKLGTRLETLYGELEEPSHGSTYIFTLLDLACIPEPAQDRLIKIELESARPHSNAENLRRVCEREAAVYDPEALLLLSQASGSYRRSIENLETVAREGAVTVDAVFAHVISARTRWLVDYFNALADGDLSAQLDACASAKLTPGEQVEGMQNALSELKIKEIGIGRNANGRRIALISHGDRKQILKFAEQLSRQSGQDLAGLWDDVMAFWASPPQPLNAASLRLHFIRFHSLVRGEVSGRPSNTPPILGRPGRDRGARRPVRRPPRAAAHGRDRFLDLQQTTALYEAASFALQRYWAPFNCRLEVTWGQGRSEARQAAPDEFLRRLHMRFDEWGVGETDGFARLSLSERSASGALVTVVVGHVPERHLERLQTWVDAQAQQGRWGAHFAIDARAIASAAQKLERHWDLMRGLWRGLSPAIAADDARALIDVLGVPPRKRRAAGVVPGRRYSTSSNIGSGAIARAIADGFPFVSGFRQGDWDQIYAGRERQVYDDWRRELDVRQQEAAWFGRAAGADSALSMAAQSRAQQRRAAASAPSELPPEMQLS